MKWTKLAPFVAITLAVTLMAGDGAALERQPNGYYRTGVAFIRHRVVLVTLTVMAVAHEMKQLPAVRSKQAVIDMDANKRFVLEMKRAIPADKLREGLAQAYEEHGYKDKAKVAQLLSVLKGELKEKQLILVSYDADKKTTTLSVPGGQSSTVPGVDLMKATWRVWLVGKDPSIGDALIARIPVVADRAKR